MTDTATTTLTDFLLARIAEDEATARAASERQGADWFDEGGIVSSNTEPDGAPGNRLDMYAPDGRWMLWDCEGAPSLGVHPAISAHIARHDPARALAQCAALRRVVEEATDAARSERDTAEARGWDGDQFDTAGDAILRALAAIWADHPEFREEWR